MTSPGTAVLESTSGPDTLVEIEALLARIWSDHDHVPVAVRMQIGIAAGEIGANIVEHAGQGRAVTIRMEVRVLPGEVWIEFADDGLPVRVDLDGVALPDDMAERGRGLALARAVLGKLSYTRNAMNHWTLVSKRFA